MPAYFIDTPHPNRPPRIAGGRGTMRLSSPLPPCGGGMGWGVVPDEV